MILNVAVSEVTESFEFFQCIICRRCVDTTTNTIVNCLHFRETITTQKVKPMFILTLNHLLMNSLIEIALLPFTKKRENLVNEIYKYIHGHKIR